MPPTVHVLELVWTAAGLVGVAFMLWVVRDAAGDLHHLPDHPPPGLSEIAWFNLITSHVSGLVLTVFTAVGVRALTLPPATTTASGEADLGTILTALGFVGSEIALTAMAGYGVWLRRRVRQLNARPWQGPDRRHSDDS